MEERRETDKKIEGVVASSMGANRSNGQKPIDIRPTARYNIVNLIRKPSDHCYEAES